MGFLLNVLNKKMSKAKLEVGSFQMKRSKQIQRQVKYQIIAFREGAGSCLYLGENTTFFSVHLCL